MGSKTVQKNDPWQPAQPYILKGLQQSGAVFDQQQPDLNKYSAMQRDTYGRLAPGAEQGIAGSQDLVNRTIGGEFLGGNPYLGAIKRQLGDDVTRDVNSQFTAAGRFGSGAQQSVLARELANAYSGLDFNNYAMERQNQIDAIGQSQDLMRGSQSLLNNAAELPWIGVGALNGNVRQASSGYGTTTTRSQPGMAQLAGGLAGAAISGWAGGGFK